MSCRSSCGENAAFVRHISRFVGETVTIFTTSGGASGCGFTGTVLSVNCNFVRLVTMQGTAPSNPLSESICGDMDSCSSSNGSGPRGFVGMGGSENNHKNKHFRVGSVCDIPINRIAAFCHNAV
jgi:hypothetical protein